MCVLAENTRRSSGEKRFRHGGQGVPTWGPLDQSWQLCLLRPEEDLPPIIPRRWEGPYAQGEGQGVETVGSQELLVGRDVDSEWSEDEAAFVEGLMTLTPQELLQAQGCH